MSLNFSMKIKLQFKNQETNCTEQGFMIMEAIALS